MEWTEGDLVWFDPGLGHPLPGEIEEVHRAAQVIVVQALINGKPQTFTLAPGEGSLRPRQDLGSSGVEDMTQLVDLHEASLLWNLRLRYDRGLIYTFAGSILIAVNPYQMFSDAYGLDIAKQYAGRPLGTLPPHLFAIGASAHASLPTPQVVVISGESGSGKTESTKLVMQYLAAVVPGGGSASAVITEQILEAAPLLEAFGNARTARNDNSSRFGKYLEVYFKQGAIVGAKITQYLLEKSRIVTQAPGERNYHVFYELLGGLPEAERIKYGLLEADKYFYLNQGGSDCAPGRVDWVALQGAMQVLGVSELEQEGIVRVLASVLHLGNVYFHRRQLRHGQEGVEVGSDAEIKWTAHLLHIPADGLHLSLTTRVTEARSERLHTPLGIDQALDARDAFAKVLYAGLFNWLVSRINSIVHKGGTHDAHRISILDIFGFEDLAENSFEQLCINFANENLQLYFNKHVFKLEQAEYARERLEWDPLSWEDNLPVIHLLAKKPVGVFHLLDDESNFPRASDLSFLEKCHYNHALNEIYSRPRIGAQEFGITHYAGQVWYCVEGFLEKNRDALRPDVLELLAASKLQLIIDMTRQLRAQRDFGKTMPRGTNGRFVTMKPRTPTVAARFSDSLQQLLQSMAKCNPWFVRCIKPNNEKHALRMDMPCVLQQLRYLGMLDTIRIRQKGYPVRLRFQHFVERYRHMVRGPLPRGTPYRELCRNVLEELPRTGIEGPDYQLGATRVFLREFQHRALESERSERLRTAAIIIQRNVRGMLTRKRVRRRQQAAKRIQAVWRGHRQRHNYVQLRKSAIVLQSVQRGRRQRKQYAALKADMQRRRSAEKAKRERQQQQIVKEQERNQVVHLDVPAELAFMFSKLDGWTPVHGDRHLVKVVGTVPGPPVAQDLPADLDQFAFGKFSSVYCNGVKLAPRRDAITVPFLTRAASRDQDFQDSLAVFKLILRWCGDTNMDAAKEKALADYITHKGLSSRGLRDEILVQQCNQVYRVGDAVQAQRIWQLMAHCLSCFQPGPVFAKYLMKFINDNAPPEMKDILLKKVLRTGGSMAAPARIFPPAWLEWRAASRHSDIAIGLTLPDEVTQTVAIDSWTTCEEAAALAISSLGIPNHGWTVTLDDSGLTTDSCGLDYVLDMVAEKELCPAFPAVRTDLLRSGRKNSQASMVQHEMLPAETSSKKRPQVPPPDPPQSQVKAAQQQQQQQQQHRRSSIEDEPPAKLDGRELPITTNAHRGGETVVRKSSHDLLSRSSALNDRYFDVTDKSRSRSMSDLLGGGAIGNNAANAAAAELSSANDAILETEPLAQLGLSGSRLNDRYLSSERLAPIVPKETAPRYQKSQYAGRRSAGSHSSKYIDRSDYATRSSAMSDTSEAPSLASHVRRVRVPSQASDVDQFLDELFSPVLDGSLDELSDARSLAASIRGGGRGDASEYTEAPFISERLDELTRSSALLGAIKGGGGDGSEKKDAELKNTPVPTTGALDKEVEAINNPLEVSLDEYITDLFQPIFVNDSLRRLTEKSQLAEAIKGGGSAHHSGTTNGFVTSPVLMNQPKAAALSTAQMQLLNEASGGNTSPVKSAESPQYQQNMQRAFLQSAMVQNLQIQQQLLAQNQALQTLLSQSQQDAANEKLLGTAGASQSTSVTTTTQQATHSAAIHSNAIHTNAGQQQSGGPHRGPSHHHKNHHSTVTPYADIDRFRRTSSESNISQHVPPPPPPPMPPPIEFKDPSETRPFLDPYGRAKTVRIGKWRWPPPQDAAGLIETADENFMHFKMRQNQRKHTPQSAGSSPNDSSSAGVEWEEFEIDANAPQTVMAIKNSNHHHQQQQQQHQQQAQQHLQQQSTQQPHPHHNYAQRKFSQPEPVAHQALKSFRRSFEIGAERPPPGSVGKLKLSSEMRQRLEQVTAGHSVRSSTSTKSEQRAPAKLEDARKMMLQQQLSGNMLAGHMGSNGDPVDVHSVRTQIQRMESTGPAHVVAGVWPNVLPPAPPGPAPPPPIRPPNVMPPMPPPPVPIVPQQQPQQQQQQQHHHQQLAPPDIPAFVQRQDRDTFGTPHHHQQQQLQQQQQLRGMWNETQSEMSTIKDDGAYDSWGRAEASSHHEHIYGHNKNSASHHHHHQHHHAGVGGGGGELRERSRSRSRSRDREHFSESVWDRNEVEGPPSSGSDRAVQKERDKRERLYELRQAERERDSNKVYQPPAPPVVAHSTADRSNHKTAHGNDKSHGGAAGQFGEHALLQSTKHTTTTGASTSATTNAAQSHERITYKTHMIQRSMESRSRKSSAASTQHSSTERIDHHQQQHQQHQQQQHLHHNDSSIYAGDNIVDNWRASTGDVAAPAMSIPAPVPVPPSLKSPAAACLTYNRVPWKLRVRKEVFRPSEPVGPPACVDLLFAQIASDVFGQTACLRISASERRNALNLLAGHGVTGTGSGGAAVPVVRAIVKRHLIDLARGWPLYFARLFVVSGSPQIPEVSLLAVSHSGVYLARRDAEHITVIRSLPYAELLGAATLPRPAALQLNLRNGNRTTLHAPRAQAIQTMVQMYCQEYRQIQSKSSTLSSGARAAAQTLNVPLERLEAQVHVSSATAPTVNNGDARRSNQHDKHHPHVNGGGGLQHHGQQQQQQQQYHQQQSFGQHHPHYNQHQQQSQHPYDQQPQRTDGDRMEFNNAQSISPISAGRSNSSNGGHFTHQMDAAAQMHGGKRSSQSAYSHQQQQPAAAHEHDEIMMHHHHQRPIHNDHDDDITLMDESMAPQTHDGAPTAIKYSLLQFAMQHFRNDQPFDEHASSRNGKHQQQQHQSQQHQSHAAAAGSAASTMRPPIDLVKWQGSLIRAPLLRLPGDISPLALECFECILRYCGDLPHDPELTEVKCVYTVLMHCHKHLTLRDEVYCQLMKQTTANRSPCADSSQRAWRLLSVLAAYFGCSDALKPYLLEHLTAAASDRRRSCHGTAAVCLTNLRKTARCGGRKNVPSVEEVTAVSAGRSARRQIYRLPGGAERVVNTRCSTVVADVIAELCALLGIDSPTEQQEFSLYCIVQGDAFTMPLAADEYILDVTTELLKSAQPFYLIFCRSVWHYQLRREPAPTPLYIEVLFNQVAPDYLEGLLLELPGGGAPNPDIVRDMARIAALLHRAADLNHVPAMKEIKFLLPKPALGIRELRPAQWVALVQSAWPSIAGLVPAQVKAQFLGVLSTWSLFGSSFFAVKRVWASSEESAAAAAHVGGGNGGTLTPNGGGAAIGSASILAGGSAAAGIVGPGGAGTEAIDVNSMWRELILALNRRGILFLDPNTHETLQHWPFMEVISTRKVRSEDGALFLDLKVGNLMQQRVIRVQTEQAHEISRLVRQYITMAQGGQQRDRRD